MSESVTVDAGPTEGGDDDQVSVEEATSEEIKAALADAIKEEESETDPQPEAEPVESKTRTEPAKLEPPKEDKPAEPVRDVAAENAKLRAQLKQSEEFSKGRSQEIGELRKTVRLLVAEKEARAKEIEVDNPREAMKLDMQVEKLRAEDQELASEEQNISRFREAMEIIPRFLKPEEMDIEAIKAELLEDGLPLKFVEEFATNPIMKTSPDTFIHLSKRAMYGKALRVIIPQLQAVMKERDELKARIGKTGESVVKGIKGALNRPAPVTASSSAADSQDRDPVIDPTTMTDAEIKAYLANNRD